MRAPPRSIRGSILLPPSMCTSSASPARPFKIDGAAAVRPAMMTLDSDAYPGE
ncbi:hypothetical protein FKP32DRAFT_1289873 [Trametes sanguinea]|nr:hypothetical protein FKP32DRAFT_1289873 [Trametes sanguinea]